MSAILGRCAFFCGISILLMLFTIQAFASSARIFEVRRNITLSNTDPIFKDYYIQVNEGQVRRNQILPVVRRDTMKDARSSLEVGEIVIPIGELRVIYSHNNIAVARLHRLFDRDELPVTHHAGIMVGDIVQIDQARAATEEEIGAVVEDSFERRWSAQRASTEPSTEREPASLEPELLEIIEIPVQITEDFQP